MNTTRGKPDRVLIAILSVIAALVVVSLAVVFSRGEPEPLDPSTPAGAVQRYAAAVLDGDEAAASALLAERARGNCTTFERPSAENVRLTLVSTVERADSADVKVSIATAGAGGPFGASEYETEDEFSLVRVDGAWLIDAAPWQFTVCTDLVVK